MVAFRVDAVGSVHQLLSQGRAGDALDLIAAIAVAPDANGPELTAYAEALRAVGRAEEALETLARAVAVAPRDAVAEHNLAAQAQRMGRYAEAEASARRSLAKGSDASETWTLLATALQFLARDAEAEQAYREALRRRPTMAPVQRDLAQLLWMRTGDAAAATAPLRAALAAYPGRPDLVFQLAEALRYAGRTRDAYDTLITAIARGGRAMPGLEIAASTIAAELPDWSAARRHAERALQAVPGNPSAIIALSDALIAAGDVEAAQRNLEPLHARLPNSQHVIARLATVWRLTGASRYGQLHDYPTFVRSQVIDTPIGWPNLAAYLADLARALREVHTARTHPFGQSIRHGTQTFANLTLSTAAPICAFFQAVDGSIRRHMDAVGRGGDPFRQRLNGGYRIHSAWSVRLRADGFHLNHVHQEGWLSSAFYVELPPAISRETHAGWLKLGEPGIATHAALGPEHLIKPEPGLLVLFPSYMWHGTVPFSGEAERLTIAFDVVPA